MPQSNIASFYPGDDAVDWVGVNIYSVTYFNQDKKQPAMFEGKFSIEKRGQFSEAEEGLLLSSVIMAMMLERSRG